MKAKFQLASLCRSLVLLCACLLLSTTAFAQFENIYGDNNPNRFTRVKTFGDAIYTLGLVEGGNNIAATFTKVDRNTGAIIWQFSLADSTYLLDFDFNPTNDNLMLVLGFR